MDFKVCKDCKDCKEVEENAAKIAEVAAKQECLIEELKQVKSQLVDLNTSVTEIVDLFREGKTVVKFFSKASKFARWLALTLASLAALWATVTHLDKTN